MKIHHRSVVEVPPEDHRLVSALDVGNFVGIRSESMEIELIQIQQRFSLT